MARFKDISFEEIRQKWSTYKEEIYNTPYYELLWSNLINKFNIDETDFYLCILQKFINNEEIKYIKPLENRIWINQIDTNTLQIKGLTSDERKNIHKLCDKIGLHHVSKRHSKKKKTKFLYIYKPKEWLWEYTEKNPYSESDEVYAERELCKQNRLQKEKQEKKNMLTKTYCNVCEKNGLETELYCSVYIDGIYCEDCLKTTSDGEGNYLCCHKFESISFLF